MVPLLGLMLIASVYVQSITFGSLDKTAIIALFLGCVALLYLVVIKPIMYFYSLLYFASMHFLNSSVEAKEMKETCTFCFLSFRNEILGELFNFSLPFSLEGITDCMGV